MDIKSCCFYLSAPPLGLAVVWIFPPFLGITWWQAILCGLFVVGHTWYLAKLRKFLTFKESGK